MIEDAYPEPIDMTPAMVADVVDGMRQLATAALYGVGGFAPGTTSPEQVQIQIEPNATDKQRRFITHLLDDLGYDDDRASQYFLDRGYDVDSLSKEQASMVINELKGMLEGRTPPQVQSAQQPGWVAEAEARVNAALDPDEEARLESLEF